MTAPLLTDARAIQAHLNLMAERLKGSVLSMGTQQVFGQLGYPHTKGGHQSFQVAKEIQGLVEPPRPGQTVHLQYQTSKAGYGFMTSYLGTYCEGLWRLALPQNVDRLWERKHQRLKVPALFRARHGTAIFQEVNEISEGGFSLNLLPEHGLGRDALIQGALSVSGLPVIGVTARVRSVETQPHGEVAGCAFESIQPEHRALIQALIRSQLG